MPQEKKQHSPFLWILLGLAVGFLLAPAKKGVHVCVRVNTDLRFAGINRKNKKSRNATGGKLE